MKNVKAITTIHALIEAHDRIGTFMFENARPTERTGKLLLGIVKELFDKLGKKIVNKLDEEQPFVLTLKMQEAVAMWMVLRTVPNLSIPLKLLLGEIDKATV